MFRSRKLNVHINRFYGRALRVVYKHFDSSFEELLRTGSSTTLHRQNLQKLMTKIFKVKIGIAPELMNGVFEFTDVPAITYYKGKEPWSIGLTFLNGKCFIERPGKIKTGILDINKLMKLVDKFCKELREENYIMITSLPLLIIFYINFKNKLIVCTKLDYAIFHDISLSCLENHGTIKKTD